MATIQADPADGADGRAAHVYTDGGIIQANPSRHGGTWAYVVLDASEAVLCEASGVVTPADVGLPAVTNNLTELFAAVRALQVLPDGWAGTLYTDSQVTMFRLVNPGAAFNGIPDGLRREVREQRRRLGAFRVVRLDGHPTQAQLASGVGKRGGTCSRWNVHVDKRCNEQAAAFLAGTRVCPEVKAA